MPISEEPGAGREEIQERKSAPAQTAHLSPPARSRLPWPILCLFQFGLILGLASVWWQTHAGPETPKEETLPPAAAAAAAVSKPETAQRSAIVLGTESLARAENLLREARYEEALAIYQPSGETEPLLLPPALRYRLALCLEGLGRPEAALSAYRSVAGQQEDSVLAAAAQLGQARVYLRLKRSSEGRDLLWDLLLKSASPTLRDEPMVADVRYLLALAASADASAQRKQNQDMVSFKVEDWTIERFLDCVALPKDVKQAPSAEERLQVSRFGRRSEDTLITACIRETGVVELLDHLAQQSGLRAQWTERARQHLLGRTTVINIERFPLVDLLYGLGERFGLLWEFQNEIVQFSSEEESSPAELARYRATIAKRRLRDAVLANPTHPLASAAYLELGNTECAHGNWHEAIAWYERIVREFPQSPVGLEAHYNLGLAQAKLGDLDAARNAYYWVADQAPGHPLAAAAYLHIGRLYLENDEPAQALRPLRRAVAGSTATSGNMVAVLTLAAAYLLTNNPRAAHASLLEARTQITQEPYRPWAAFLDSLARYRAIGDRRLAEREGSEVLAALLLLRDDVDLEPLGSLLMGEAYSQLGMTDQMVAVYEKALPGVRGPLAAQMAYALAEYGVAQDNRERARQLYETVITAQNSKWTPRAQQRLAEMALQDKQLAKCLDLCRELLLNQDKVTRSSALQLMGRAFEQRGDHRQAARCFAGQTPEP
jgi:tetratricopeptide (TPR) repeat protein